jgi:putative peptidoglycan lipid II flippase
MELVGIPDLAEWKTVRPVFSGSLALLPATMVGAFIMLIEQSIAASMGDGSNAALAYGFRLPAALQSLFVTAIGITALPYFASRIAKGQYEYCLHSLKKLFWALSICGTAIAIPLVIFSAEIISLLYQRGAFDVAAAERVVPIQTAYFVQIPFVLLTMLGIKILAALGRNVEVGIISAAAGILQCILAYELTQKFNVVGIAWAATIMSALVAVVTFTAARSNLERHLR